MTERRRLIPILGDQLDPGLALLRGARKDRDVVLLAEVGEEAAYVPHHKRKIAFTFAAMRHHRDLLRERGWRVRYTAYDDPDNTHSLKGEAARALKAEGLGAVAVTEPGEWRLLEDMKSWAGDFGVPVEIAGDRRFFTTPAWFRHWAEGRKILRMEDFYREMRKRTGILMQDGAPAGGKWNFDRENRKPPKKGMTFPAPPRFEPDAETRAVLDLVERRFSGNFGRLDGFALAVTAADAEKALDHFVERCLPDFGDYQDAMVRGERFMFHSLLSVCINAGLLDPRAVCERAVAAWEAGHAPLNAVEGFVRQILGWREFVRGVYWLKMPDYAQMNELDQRRSLPDFYWTAETDMACVGEVIAQTRDEAYAHHIQRLMVTGNLAMLLGVKPAEIHEWYLAVYADAYEWVELPNTLGMSQFADGGLLGSKPYAAGGNYINRMSDYCAGCRYDVKQRTGPDACPFNYLYWDFLDRKRDRLGGNHRLRNVYATWDRMDDGRKRAIREDALRFRRNPR